MAACRGSSRGTSYLGVRSLTLPPMDCQFQLENNVGLLKRIQARVKKDIPEEEVIFLMIHQEALCTYAMQFQKVVKPVVKLVNFIWARGLQHRRFIKFPEETDADHQDLLYHSNVCWLSLGNVCQWVWKLKQKIISFLDLLEKAANFPELSDTDWLYDLPFAADKLMQMSDQFVHEMYTNVRAIKTKLALFSKKMSNKFFVNFLTLVKLKEAPQHMREPWPLWRILPSVLWFWKN